MPGGLFITLEGGDGSGKSTQVEVLALRLYDEISAPVHIVREPGGTALGNWLRQVLKYTAVPRTPETELLLFNASRAQLVSQVIRPALEKGQVVVSDRFSDSTVAYQGYGRGLPLKHVEAVNTVGTLGLKPDLTILLDFPPEEKLKRGERQVDVFERRAVKDFSDGLRQGELFSGGVEQKDVMAPGQWSRQGTLFKGGYEDKEAMDFHRRVRQGYLKLAQREPGRWLIIDARLPQEEISQLVWQRVESMLPASGRVKA